VESLTASLKIIGRPGWVAHHRKPHAICGPLAVLSDRRLGLGSSNQKVPDVASFRDALLEAGHHRGPSLKVSKALRPVQGVNHFLRLRGGGAPSGSGVEDGAGIDKSSIFLPFHRHNGFFPVLGSWCIRIHPGFLSIY
jgi:hypothetical protein